MRKNVKYQLINQDFQVNQPKLVGVKAEMGTHTTYWLMKQLLPLTGSLVQVAKVEGLVTQATSLSPALC